MTTMTTTAMMMTTTIANVIAIVTSQKAKIFTINTYYGFMKSKALLWKKVTVT